MDRDREVLYAAVAEAAAVLRNLPGASVERAGEVARSAVVQRCLRDAAQLPLLIGSRPVAAALGALLAAADGLIAELDAARERSDPAASALAADAFDVAFGRYLQTARAELGLVELNGGQPHTRHTPGGTL